MLLQGGNALDEALLELGTLQDRQCALELGGAWRVHPVEARGVTTALAA